jgi:tetratricopeptide (TPR) repeat protein
MTPLRRITGLLLALALFLPASIQGQSWRSDPSQPWEYHLYKAGAYYFHQNWFSALAFYEKAVEEGLEDPVVYYRMGYAARQLRKTEAMEEWFGKAEQLFEAAAEREDATVVPFYHLAAIRSYRSPVDAAVREVSQAGVNRYEKGGFGPTEELCGADLFRLSRLYNFLGRHDEVRRLTALASDRYMEQGAEPTDPYVGNVYMARAAEQVAVGDYAAAATLYDQLVRLRPQTPGAAYSLAVTRIRSGNPEGALEAFRKAARVDSSRASEAAYAQALLGAIVEYRKANPKDAFEVEPPESGLPRAQIEERIREAVEKVGSLRAAMKAASVQSEPAASGDEAVNAADEVERRKKRRMERKKKKAAQKEAVSADAAKAAELARAEAELRRLLLSYLLRGFPIRELAFQYQLFGFIFPR